MNQGIGDDKYSLDEETKWLYAKEKGVEVFAIYGIDDGTEPTVLYASRSSNAEPDLKRLINFQKEWRGLLNDTDGKAFASWLVSFRNERGQRTSDYDVASNGRTAMGLDGLLSEYIRHNRGVYPATSLLYIQGITHHKPIWN